MTVRIERVGNLNLPSHIILETLTDGRVAAWILELPDCRVIAESKEAAIKALKPLFDRRMEQIEIIPVASLVNNPWANFYGVLKDNPDLQQWANNFWAQKQQSHDDEPILSVADCLQVMA
jgi:hypothetical protein